MKLERVEIARLRGIPGGWPALPIGDKGLIVYGPNGVGKSSIIDALEATIRGQSSLFKDNRAEGVNWSDASPHIKGGPPSCTVHGKLNGKPQAITMGAAVASDLSDWIAAAKAASFVLRRYMLLQFIDAEPRGRYEQIEPFLNLAHFNELERQLDDIVRGLETTIATVNTQSAIKAQAIRQTFSLAKDTALNRSALIGLLKATLKSAGLPSADADVADLTKVSATLAGELGGQVVNQKLTALGVVKHQAQQLTSASVLLALYEKTVAAADQLLATLGASTHKVPIDLLSEAHDHIVSTTDEICPVCEQDVDRTALLKRLEERIKENDAVRLAAATLDQRVSALSKASATAREAYSSFRIAWGKLGLEALPPCYAAAEKLYAYLEGLTTKSAGSKKEAIKAAFASAECEPNAQIAILDAAMVTTGGGERRAKLVGAQSYAKSLQGDVSAFEVSEKKAAVLSKQKTVVEKLHAHAQTARKEAVQKIADRVTQVANDFYDKVHPGEGIATSKLVVRQAANASMVLHATFHGQEAPPLKYYSESHLDTLGLCFFLAIRKLEIVSAPIFKLLLIDDVLHSVDADHRTRLAQLLKDNFGDHQIVLVTHDKNFYDRLRATLGGGYKYIAISSWDIDSGPHLSDPSTDLDRVIDPATRAGKSHDEIAAAGGRFFEWLLKELTERLQVPLVARFTHPHDIGSMWPPLAAKLAKHKGFAAAHPELVKKLNENVWVRNKIGAHANDEAESPVTPAEVTEFVDGVAALYKATICPENTCGTPIQVSKDNKEVWRCGCSKLQYGP